MGKRVRAAEGAEPGASIVSETGGVAMDRAGFLLNLDGKWKAQSKT
jgi:hypothetical protein